MTDEMIDQVTEIRLVRKLEPIYSMEGVEVTHINIGPENAVPGS